MGHSKHRPLTPDPGFTYHQLGIVEAAPVGGRFAAETTSKIVGRDAEPYPAAGHAQTDPTGNEPVLGYAIDDLAPVGEGFEIARAAEVLADRAAASNPFAGMTDAELRAEHGRALASLKFRPGQDNGRWTEATQDADNRRIGIEQEQARRASIFAEKPAPTANSWPPTKAGILRQQAPKSLAEMTDRDLEFCIARAHREQMATFEGGKADELQAIIDNARAELDRRRA